MAQGAPQQVLAVIAEGDADFPIDRAGGLEEELAVAKPVLEVGFVAIEGASVKAQVHFNPSNKPLSLSSKVRRSRALQTTPSWRRAATGTARQMPAAWTNKATACKEWPMMKEALALQRDSW